MNPYTYIFNNPLSGIDPTGYQSESDGKPQDKFEGGQGLSVKDGVQTTVFNAPLSGGSGNTAVNNGVDVNKVIQIVDKVISELENKVKENTPTDSVKFGDGRVNTDDLKALVELRSYRKQLQINKELTDKHCKNGGCKGTISPALTDAFIKLTQSFGINVAMSVAKVGNTAAASDVRILTTRSGSTNSFLTFSAEEISVINEARNIISSDKFSLLVQAGKLGRAFSVKINGRIIQFEPELRGAGFTLFGENGFLIGSEAFASSNELKRTVLHELFRLKTSKSLNGVSAPLASSETATAQNFADKAFREL
jgi:hypothetical protein